jgi:glycosyltransferase involved in cell wall biosynthesis
LVLDKYTGVHFEIVGNEDPTEPNFRAQLVADIDRLSLSAAVTMSPFAIDPTDFIRSLSCLANVSFPAEPFGMSIIEAMALGRPVIASANGGPSEIIDHGRNGILVPARDPSALAKAIVSLRKDPVAHREMGMAARQRVSEAFEVRRQVAEQEALLRTLVH